MKQHAAPKSGHFHAVRFYEDEESLYRIVTDFVGDGLVAGQPAVVIATPVHGKEIARALQALAFDVSRLRASGDLLVLDADEMLSTFMRDGVPDPDAFRCHVGGVLKGATTGRPITTAVRAYGEMVDCLWKSDAAVAAVRLEVLWNQLADTCDFSLLCGYSMGHFYKQGAYEDICGQHTHVMAASGHPTRIGVS